MNSVKSQDRKVNVQKYVASLHTNNEATKIEIKKTIPFTVVTKIRYLGVDKPNQRGERPALWKL